MSNEVTIDELRIEIEAESGTAADNLDDLAKSLDRLQAVTQRMTGGGDGLNKVAKQIEKLNAISQNIRSMRGFERLGKVVNQLAKLDRLSNVGDISGFVRNLSKLPQAVNAIAQMPSIDTAKFQQIADALKPLNDLGTNNINSFLRTLGKFPQTAQQLAGVDLTQFEQQIRRISTSLEPLTRQAERGGAGLTALAQIMQSTSRQARQSSSGVSLFNQTIGNIKVKTLAAIAGLRRLFSVLKSSVTTSNDYVENLNLFTVTMGGAADEALKFAEAVNSALGVDVSDWIRYQGVFKQMTSGFGMIEEKANLVSKNLTQLGFDISSYFNISVDDAMQKLQSGMAGEQEPLRRLGYALDEATIKQVALNHGITESVTNMSQAQKAQLRYIAIMEQSTNAMGDMARTIDSPANQIRILEARIQTLKRAIGDSLMPVVSAALPYITAFVQILGEAFRGVAEFMGFELPEFDYSDVMTKQNENIANSFDDATEASNKFKGTLAGIDQLNIIGSKDEGKSSAGNENQFDLGLELPEYDFLQGVESKTKQIVEDIKAWLPVIGAVGSAIAGAFAISKISKFTDGIKNIATIFGKNIGTDKLKDFSKTLGGIVGGLAAGASSGILLNSGIKNLITGTGKLGGNIAKVASGAVIAGGAIAAFVKLGNPVGAVITGIGAAIGIVTGLIQGSEEKTRALNEEIMNSVLYKNGGTKITEVADAFSDWAIAQKNVNDKITAGYAELEQYSDNMQGVLDELDKITGYEVDFSKMTPADAEALKEPFSQLTTYLEGDFTTKVNAVATSLQDAFANLNIGEGIAAEVQGALKGVERAFDQTLTENDKIVSKYLDKIAEGKTLSETEYADLTNRYSAQTEITLLKDENVQNAKKAFEELDLSKIDLENEAVATEQLQKISDTSNALAQSIKDRIMTESASLDRMMEEYQILYNKGLIDKTKFDEQTDIINLSKNILAQNASAQMTELRDKVKSITDPLWEQIESKKGTLPTNLWDNLTAIAGDIDAQDVAWSKWVDSNEVYKQLQTMDYERSTYSVSVDTDFTYATEGAAKMAQVIQQDITPQTDILIGKLQDETGEWKYLVGKESAMLKANVTQIMGSDGWKILTGEKTAQIKAELVNSPFTEQHKQWLSSNGYSTIGRVQDDLEKKYSKYSLSNYSSKDFIPDLSIPYKLPAQNVALGGTVGAARDAVSNATQGAVQGSAVAAEFTIYNYTTLDVEGDTIAEGVSQYQQRQMAYSNGQ